jgi:Mn-dependent DtxR family transcriptional regulator
MTTARRVKAGDVLKVIEEHGPATSNSVASCLSVGNRWVGGVYYRLAIRGLIRRDRPPGMFAMQYRYEITLRGRALLAARRAKGRR